MLFYIIIGVNDETNAIADLEQEASRKLITEVDKLAQIDNIIANVPKGKTLALLHLITVVPAALFIAAYTIFKKKFIINESYFDEITAKIAERNAKMEADAAAAGGFDVEVEASSTEVSSEIGNDGTGDDPGNNGVA